VLREKLRRARLELSSGCQREAGQAVAASGLEAVRALVHPRPHLAGPPAQTPIALYAPLSGELDCLPLLHRLAAAGYPTLLPVTQGKAKPLRFHLWRPGDGLVAGPYGLKHPRPDALELTPKIIFAPLLGFDGQGGRLGYGGGYYDATLAQLRRVEKILAGGLAFSFQKIDAIPLEAHDQRLDFVLTEEKLLDFNTD
jgi:5-formyltetrahydrofolate cyclo-ligase